MFATKLPISSIPSRFTGGEARQRERHRVRAGTQVDDAVLAGAVGDDGADVFDQWGLAASTVTPGSTAPEGSFTVPAIAACANAATGRKAIPTKATSAWRARTGMNGFLLDGSGGRYLPSGDG